MDASEYSDEEEWDEDEAAAEAQEIPRDQWSAFFERLTRQYEGENVVIETRADNHTAHLVAADLPFAGISVDARDGDSGTIQIMVGMEPDDHLTHTVTEPTYVWFYQNPEGEEDVIEIESADSPTTIIRL